MPIMRTRAPRALRIVALAFVTFALSACLNAEEQSFFDQTNSLRASKGIPALIENADLSASARAWSEKMAREGRLYHSRIGDARFSRLNWAKLGENVGKTGPGDYDWVTSVQRAFVNSPGHYKNLVSREFTHVGVGTAHAPDGTRYVTVLFMKLR